MQGPAGNRGNRSISTCGIEWYKKLDNSVAGLITLQRKRHGNIGEKKRVLSDLFLLCRMRNHEHSVFLHGQGNSIIMSLPFRLLTTKDSEHYYAVFTSINSSERLCNTLTQLQSIGFQIDTDVLAFLE